MGSHAAQAKKAIEDAGFNPVEFWDLAGPSCGAKDKGKVRAQNPDWTLCRPLGSDVTYHLCPW
jgi:hypothetical protein